MATARTPTSTRSASLRKLPPFPHAAVIELRGGEVRRIWSYRERDEALRAASLNRRSSRSGSTPSAVEAAPVQGGGAVIVLDDPQQAAVAHRRDAK
jgi:hypothetical protein